MRIEHCRYIIAVSESCNISQTAEKFYITQQGLSQAIKAVERELDVTFFMRTGNSLQPTAEGLVVIDRLRRIVEEYDGMRLELGTIREEKQGAIPVYTIYVTPNVANSVLPKILTSVYKRTPHPRMKVVEALPLDIADAVSGGEENTMGIISIPEFLIEQSEPFRSGSVEFREYERCPLMAYVSQSSPLAAKTCIDAETIRRTPLAIYPSELNMVAHILGDSDVQPEIVLNSSNMMLFRSLVSKTDAMGLTTTMFEKNARAYPLTLIPLEQKINILWGCLTYGDRPTGYWDGEIMAAARAAMY